MISKEFITIIYAIFIGVVNAHYFKKNWSKFTGSILLMVPAPLTTFFIDEGVFWLFLSTYIFTVIIYLAFIGIIKLISIITSNKRAKQITSKILNFAFEHASLNTNLDNEGFMTVFNGDKLDKDILIITIISLTLLFLMIILIFLS